MIRIKENIESLNAIREKCKKRQTDFNQEELTHLNLVFIELQKSYGKRHVRPLDRSCSSCVLRFMSSVHNYIMGEEIGKSEKSLNKTKEGFKKLFSAIVDLKDSESSKSITISSGEVEVEQDKNEKHLDRLIVDRVKEDSRIDLLNMNGVCGSPQLSNNIMDEINVLENEKLTLPELREKYPNVKARSKEKFLRLLNENK